MHAALSFARFAGMRVFSPAAPVLSKSRAAAPALAALAPGCSDYSIFESKKPVSVIPPARILL
jgi:hypothetical protein